MGSAFTYQGRLQDGASVANGRYDFTFRLLDALTAGNQIGTTQTLTNLAVSNGLFIATVDFGFGPFNGTAYWVELGVRSNGLATFTVLVPRQALTPVPLALYAPQAGAAATVLANAVSTASLQDGVVTSNKIAGGQAVKSLNGLKDNVIVAATGTVALSTNGNSLLMTGTGWGLSGNSGAGNVLGTTDLEPLNLMVNKVFGLRIQPPPSGESPNLIGGYGSVDAGLYGVTIAGGGETNLPNYAADVFVSIGGGRGNQVLFGSYDATVGGGYQNLIDTNAVSGVIGGGEYNLISGGSASATIAGGSLGTIGVNSLAAVIGGGAENYLDDESTDSMIGGGWQNYVGWGAPGSAILGGEQNTILDIATNATISGGLQNTNGGSFSVIGGGAENVVLDAYGGTIGGGSWNYTEDLADYSTIGGGFDNYIQYSATYATIPGGAEASARDYGQLAYASGCTTNYGDAQASLFVLRRTTTTSGAAELFLDGSSQRISVPANGATSFQVMIIARTSTGNITCYEAKGGVKNVGGVVTFAGNGVTLTSTLVGTSEITGLAAPQLLADSTTQTLKLRVTGLAGRTIRWVARVQTVEVSF
jgi:hypothetical protein